MSRDGANNDPFVKSFGNTLEECVLLYYVQWEMKGKLNYISNCINVMLVVFLEDPV